MESTDLSAIANHQLAQTTGFLQRPANDADITGVTTVGDLIRAHEGYQRRKGHAASSSKRNGHYLRSFAEWSGDRHIGSISSKDIELGFLADWHNEFEQRKGRPPAPRTTRNMIQQLRGLYHFADRFDFLVGVDGKPVRNPMLRIDPPKVRRIIKDWVTEVEFGQMMDSAVTEAEMFTVVWLGMTAMRVGEAGSVPWKDVDLTSVPGSILIRSGKTDESARSITVTSELRIHIQRHLLHQRERGLADPDTPVWCTRTGKGVREQQANRTLKRLAKRVGMTKTVSCHAMRRGWAMTALARGLSTEVVADHLGHENPATTAAHYGRVQRPQVEAEIIRAFG